jgi:hypothetical protein
MLCKKKRQKIEENNGVSSFTPFYLQNKSSIYMSHISMIFLFSAIEKDLLVSAMHYSY